MTFAQKLKRARLAAGLTQKEASKRAGVVPPRWSIYEHGKESPTLSMAARLAKAVGVTLGELV